MANTNAPSGFRIYSVDGNPAINLQKALLGSNVSCKIGDDLFMSTSGLLFANGTTQAIWGIAAEAITGVSGSQQYVHYYPAREEFTLIGQSIGTVAVTQAKIGTKCRVGGSSGARGPDLSHTTGGNLIIVGLSSQSALSTYAQLLLKITKNALTGQA